MLIIIIIIFWKRLNTYWAQSMPECCLMQIGLLTSDKFPTLVSYFIYDSYRFVKTIVWKHYFGRRFTKNYTHTDKIMHTHGWSRKYKVQCVCRKLNYSFNGVLCMHKMYIKTQVLLSSYIKYIPVCLTQRPTHKGPQSANSPSSQDKYN